MSNFGGTAHGQAPVGEWDDCFQMQSAPGAILEEPLTMMHTSIFVNNMAESIDFYTNKLGLKLLGGPNHYPGNADMAFVGKDWNAYIELVFDLEEHPPYEIGNRVEHLAMDTDGDLLEAIERLRSQGVKITKEPKKSPGGDRWIAFVEDPNGIPVELLEPRNDR